MICGVTEISTNLALPAQSCKPKLLYNPDWSIWLRQLQDNVENVELDEAHFFNSTV